MEWLIAIAVIVGLFYLVTGGITGAARKAQEADPDRFLDEWFDGRQQVIVERAPHMLEPDVILAGANDRGYRCVSTEQMAYPKTNFSRMLFEKSALDGDQRN